MKYHQLLVVVVMLSDYFLLELTNLYLYASNKTFTFPILATYGIIKISPKEVLCSHE